MPFHFLSSKRIDTIPKTPGVYALSSPKEILYIGKALELRSRIKNHFQQPSYRDNLFVHHVTRVGYQETISDIEALLLEAQLIKKHQPRYNVMWRDDKKYFYVGIDPAGCTIKGREKKLPRIFITHQPTKNSNFEFRISNLRTNTRYIGPFTEGRSLKKVLRLLRRTFPYYTTKTHPAGPCPYCHIDLCPGPNPDVSTYKKTISHLAMVLEGKKATALKTIEKEMRSAGKAQRYERAAELRDQYFALQRIIEHTSLFSPIQERNESYAAAEEELRALLSHPSPIVRIEAYDISNIQGKYATGSMPVFVNGKPAKNLYRKFRIRTKNTPDDFTMMQEVISRRLRHPEWEYPDLMVIDGGKGQLTAALRALRNFETQISNSETNSKLRQNSKLPAVVALAKKQNELFIPGKEQSILLSSLKPETRNLLMHIRDEAHRFAITYYRKLHSVDMTGE